MAVAAFPARAKRSLPRLRLPTTVGKLLRPVRPVLANLAAIPFTVAGWGLISAAAFQVSTVLGLAAGGVILMVLEHQIADEP